MKKIYFAIAFAIIPIVTFCQSNIIGNGDLENWTSGVLDQWVTQEGQVNQETTVISSGISSALFIDGTTTPKIISQNFILQAGETYKLTYDFKVKTANPSFGQQVIGYKYGPTDSYPLSSGSRIPQDFEWTTHESIIDVTETKEWKFELSLFSFTNEAFEVYIDNIKLVNVKAEADRQVLIALYNATNGSNWTKTWDLNQPVGTWHGITVDSENRVTKIDLTGNNLSGNIPETIGNLSNLTELRLYSHNQGNNNLTGNIPESIGNLTNLTSLMLGGNNLEGGIPESIGNLINLTHLGLGDNNFEGNIPEFIGNLTNLTWLSLYKNNFQGNIPEFIGNLTNLSHLDLSDNSITGNIPAFIGNLSNLSLLYLDWNNLEGEFPEFIGDLTNLSHIDLSGNKTLTGNIPESIGNLINLERLDLSGNSLTGNIPESIGNLTTLERLDLSFNNLTGQIPPSIGNLTGLIFLLDLSRNDLIGNIPESIGNLTNLRWLNLISNNIEGTIPESVGNLIEMERLLLNSNKLEGNIPESVTNLPDLLFLSTENNNFVFEDIEPIINTISETVSFSYDSQTNIGEPSTASIDLGGVFSIQVEATSSPNNQYQWYKDDVAIEGATGSNYEISSIERTDDGVYTCEITNTVATNLTLSKNPITLNVVVPDTDGDGIDDDLDQCPNTPTGEEVDTNGCSQSQLDDDNDGIANNIDECPDTPLGEIVGETGCSQGDVLGNHPVQVRSINTSCPDTNNGEIVVEANNNLSNQVTVSGSGYNQTFNSLSGSEDLVITDLAPGSYEVCVTFDGYENPYCTSVNIEATEGLTSSKAQVDIQGKKASFYVSGSTHYEVLVNNTPYQYNVEHTATTKIDVPLETGINEIILKTDKTCQGEEKQIINFEDLTFYPNPVVDYLSISGLKDFTDIEIYITDLAGNMMTSQAFDKIPSSLRISLHNLPSGVYIVNIKTDTQTLNTKIYKK